MSVRTILVIALALIFGCSAAVGIANLRSLSPTTETVPILLAAVDIPSFGLIHVDMVKTYDCPKDLLPPGAITKIEDALDRCVLNPLVKGEILIEGKLAPRGAGRGMAAVIPEGMRAYTIHTPTVEAGVAGFILPGNHIDVLLTMEARGDRDQTGGGSTITLLQRVLVLAIEQRVVAPAESKVDPTQVKSVTLLVTPRAAAKLNLGQSKGKLHLSLRNLTDKDDALTRPVFATELWGEKQPETPKPEQLAKPTLEAAPPAPPPPQVIRTLRGTQEGAVRLNPTGN